MNKEQNMNIEQLRAEFEAWANGRCELHLVNPAGRYSSATTQFAWEAYQAGRAALQSQDREDAERRRKAKRTWRIFRLETLPGVTVANRNGIPWADLETQVDIAIDHARRVEGDGE